MGKTKELMSMKNETPMDERPPISHEGFSISKTLTSDLSKAMTENKAHIGKITLTKVRTMNNRNVMLLIYEPENLSFLERMIMKLVSRYM